MASQPFLHYSVNKFPCLLQVLVGFDYGILFLYRKEAARNRDELDRLKHDKGALERRLNEAFHYIGTVNIQIEEIRSVFSDIRKFPENKRDFHSILQFMAEKALCMVNAAWVLFRIVDTQNLDTLSEYSKKCYPITMMIISSGPQLDTISSRLTWALIRTMVPLAFHTVLLKDKCFGRTFRRTHANPWARKEVFI